MNELYWVFLNPCTLLLIPVVGVWFWARRHRTPKVKDTRRIDDGWMNR